MEVMENLVLKYKMEQDHRNGDKLSGEIEQIEIEWSDTQSQAQQVMDTLSNLRAYEEFLEAISHQEELSTEQTEPHQTPLPVTRNSDKECQHRHL